MAVPRWPVSRWTSPPRVASRDTPVFRTICGGAGRAKRNCRRWTPYSRRPVGPGGGRMRWHSGIGSDGLLRRRVAGRVVAPTLDLGALDPGALDLGGLDRRPRARRVPVRGRPGRGRPRRRSRPCCSAPRASTGRVIRRPPRASAPWWPIGALSSPACLRRQPGAR